MDVSLLRFWPLCLDAGVLDLNFLSPDYVGERTYAARQSYNFIDQNLPRHISDVILPVCLIVLTGCTAPEGRGYCPAYPLRVPAECIIPLLLLLEPSSNLTEPTI